MAPASVNTGQSVGVTTRLEQSQRINRVTSTSFISNQPTVLVKVLLMHSKYTYVCIYTSLYIHVVKTISSFIYSL